MLSLEEMERSHDIELLVDISRAQAFADLSLFLEEMKSVVLSLGPWV